MAASPFQTDFWLILGFNLLVLWPVVLLLGRGAAALSVRGQGPAIQATAGALLLCLLSALAQGCFKTVLWGILPGLWLVFQSGREGERQPFSLPIFLKVFLGDWATGAGLLLVWTGLSGMYLRIWTPAPLNPFTDAFFYARTAHLMAQSGLETSLQELLHFMPGSVAGPTPYHYAEIWLAGFLGNVSGLSPAFTLEFSVWPLMLTLAALWLTQIIASTLNRPLFHRLAIACLLVLAVSGGTLLPGLDRALTHTHRYLSQYGLTHFYGIKLLWLFIPALGMWGGWKEGVPPLYQPSLGWLLLVPMLNIVFPLVVLAGGAMGLIAFRRSFHLPSAEVTLATIATGLWYAGFYLFSGGLEGTGAITQSGPEGLSSLLRAVMVEGLQAQNAIGYWGLVKALPLLLVFIPYLRWQERFAVLAWAVFIWFDLAQPFPYASIAAAGGLFVGGIWLCRELFRRQHYMGLLAVLVLLMAPCMVLTRSLPDAHQFFYLPVTAAGSALLCWGYIQAIAGPPGRWAIVLLVMMACLGAAARFDFVRRNHDPVDLAFMNAWKDKGWTGPNNSFGSGIFFSKDLPPADSIPAARPLPDLEWVLPGASLTDASPYVMDPARILPIKRAFIEMLPFRQYCRLHRLPYGPNLVGFCVQNRVSLACVPKSVKLPAALARRVTDSLSLQRYNLYRLNTGP